MFNEEVYLVSNRKPAVMSASEEHERAQRVCALRTELWRTVLGAPISVDALAEHLAPTDRDSQGGLGRRVRRLGKNLRESRRVRQDTLDRMVGELARLDPEAGLARSVVHAVARGSEVDASNRAHRQALRCLLGAFDREKHHFAVANLGLVFKVASRYKTQAMSLHDLVQEGCLGLLKAIDMFEPDRGFRFSTYAVWWIRHAVGRALADRGRVVRIPVHLVTLHSRASKVRRHLEAQGAESVSLEALAEACQVAPERLDLAQRAMTTSLVSLEQPGSDDNGPLELRDDDAFAGVELRVSSERIDEAMHLLNHMEADVLRKRFGLERDAPMTLQQIGKEYALSRERIRQIELRALEKMRNALAVDAA